MKNRRLTLAKESLGELSTDEMQLVVGAGTHVTCQTGVTYCPCTALIGTIDRPAIGTVDTPCQTR